MIRRIIMTYEKNRNESMNTAEKYVFFFIRKD